MNSANNGKGKLREEFLRIRKAYSAEKIAGISSAICDNLERISAHLPKGAVVSTFWPISKKNEIDLRPLIKALKAKGIRVALPVIDEVTNRMFFREFVSEEKMTQKRFGIYEPDESCADIKPTELSLVTVPALSIDKYGNRIGYGGGYYDRFLATLQSLNPKAQLVGVVPDEFLVSTLPHDSLDKPVDLIVTDRKIQNIENTLLR